MLKKLVMLNMFLVLICGILYSELQPMKSGQIIGLNGKVLESLVFKSSDNQTTKLGISANLRMFGTSVQAWFNAGNSVTFSIQPVSPDGDATVYNLQMMKSAGGTTDFAPLGSLKGAPNFELIYNGVSTGYYFGPGVTQFTIAPTLTYPAINIPMGFLPPATSKKGGVSYYTLSALGNYFPEIAEMSFVDATGKTHTVGASQITALNRQYQALQPGGPGMSIRVYNNNFVALFAEQSPFVILPKANKLGYPVRMYINNIQVASIGGVLTKSNPNGPLLCVLQK